MYIHCYMATHLFGTDIIQAEFHTAREGRISEQVVRTKFEGVKERRKGERSENRDSTKALKRFRRHFLIALGGNHLVGG